MNMTEKEVLSKVKENFKKKRKFWKIDLGTNENLDESYDLCSKLHDYLSNSFDADQKEKFSFNKLKTTITPTQNGNSKKAYQLFVEYN